MTGEGRLLRALLVLAATTVQPSGGGLAAIRARIHARRPWWRRAWDRATGRDHVHDYRPDAIDPEDERCWCGAHTEDKAAAPDAPEAAAEPDDREEPKDMSHDLIEESTPRGRQMLAALTLTRLLESGPRVTCTWRIDQDGGLHGHVVEADLGPRGDERAIRGMVRCAEFLGAQVRREQSGSAAARWTVLSAGAVYRGTPVTVWTHVDIRPAAPAGGAA